ETEHPVSGGSSSCSLAQRGLDFRNRGFVAGDHAQVLDPRLDGMRVGIVKPWEDGFAAQINLAAAPDGKMEHVVIGARGEKAAAGDSHRLGARQERVYRPDVAVVEDEFGFGALQRQI